MENYFKNLLEKMKQSNLKLGITKIEDLLIRQTISQAEDGKPKQEIHLVVPNYQRPYKWSSKNVVQLLDDIIHAKNENKEVYRVGTLILHFDKEKKNYNIVDGQQRTITFSLLLKALSPELNIPFLEQSLTNNLHNKRNIPKNYQTLVRRCENFGNKKEKDDLLEYIFKHCELIVVITEDISEAFQFFDSQNARGKKLYPHDLLKAFHLREMKLSNNEETEKTVKIWEEQDQSFLSILFSDYLYRIKQWVKGNYAEQLSEKNINLFKGITQEDNFPFAQFYKGAFAYADSFNQSSIPFVSGIKNIKPFQLDAPIIAGKPFFDFAKHYYDILKDIQNNDKYEGYLINDNDIVKTLDLPKNKNGVGNRITRLLFDTAILLYVDRFTPPQKPTKTDLNLLDQFTLFAFIWAYSLRAQYVNLGWHSAQLYIFGNNEKINSLNIYKAINDVDSPIELLSILSDQINPINKNKIVAKTENINETVNDIYVNYLHYFEKYNFLTHQNENK